MEDPETPCYNMVKSNSNPPDSTSKPFIQLALLTYSAISLAHSVPGSNRRGAAATAVSVAANVACELWVASATDWHQGWSHDSKARSEVA